MTGCRVAVAFSGGRDSTALLHATRAAARELAVEVIALHVHHGLRPEADAWLAHCRRLCRRWQVGFAAERLDTAPAAGDSVEAWARDQRYRALTRLAHEQRASLVLLAHHRRDQAETFLLQALRGGGMAGLAAMPAQRTRDGIVWARPWLSQPRESIEAYVRRHRLRFVDDDSNTDVRYARNRLRADVWPALTKAFPGAEAALADAARRAAQASELLDGIADSDLGSTEQGLDVVRWRRLEPARGRNALRRWLQHVSTAPSALIERLLLELPNACTGRWPAGGQAELRLYRGRLRLERFDLLGSAAAGSGTVLSIDGPGEYALHDWGGRIVVTKAARGGVAVALLHEVRCAARQGGERFQSALRSPPRSLKKQFQAQGVAAWRRDGPLLYAGERLLFVPGLGIDARLRAADGEPQCSLQWVQDARR